MIGRKVDYRFGSIWDELPKEKQTRRVPETQDEALELYEAAKLSLNTSTMITWDRHNDIVAKSQELRKIAARKEAVERQNIEHRLEQTRLIEGSARR